MRKLTQYLESLSISQGEGAGERIRLFPWQRRFLTGCFRQDGDAALSIARGAGKTTLMAGIACAFIDGPLRQPRAEVVAIASSFAQGKLLFDHCRAFMGDKLGDKKTWRVSDSDQTAFIEHRPTGAKLRTLGCDPRRAHGLAPALILADEPAQWEHTKSERMVSALRTAMGKIPGSRLIAIGTRAEGSQHWFEVALNGGFGYGQSHCADPDDDPFKRRTWAKANPSLRYFPALLKRMIAEAKEARTDPSKLPSFKALRLNMGGSDVLQSYLLKAEDWRRIEGDVARTGPFILGIDLGTSAAMSAASGFWPATGRLEAIACFPQEPGLAERGLADGVGRLYADIAAAGDLIIRGKRVSDIRGLLAEVRSRWGHPLAIACDRWREAELRDCLEAENFPAARLEIRGMGFKDGSEDCRAFRSACLSGRVSPVPSLLLTAAMSEARLAVDPSGNAKLAKSSEGGRRLRSKDDAVAAAILAVATGVRLWADGAGESKGVYLGKV